MTNITVWKSVERKTVALKELKQGAWFTKISWSNHPPYIRLGMVGSNNVETLKVESGGLHTLPADLQVIEFEEVFISIDKEVKQ